MEVIKIIFIRIFNQEFQILQNCYYIFNKKHNDYPIIY